MKKIIFLVLIFSYAISYAQELSRKVIYTLQPGEEIYSNEYMISIDYSQEKNCALIYNRENKIMKILFNGKIVGVLNNFNAFNYELWDLNLIYSFENNFYSYCFEKDDGKYVNVNGKILGPYEDVVLPESMITLNSKYFGFFYKLMNTWWAYYQGDVYGPIYKVDFEVFNAIDSQTSLSRWTDEQIKFEYKIIEKNTNPTQYFIDIDQKQFGPYDRISVLENNGIYVFSYKRNEELYININNEIFGPFKEEGFNWYYRKILFFDNFKYFIIGDYIVKDKNGIRVEYPLKDAPVTIRNGYFTTALENGLYTYVDSQNKKQIGSFFNSLSMDYYREDKIEKISSIDKRHKLLSDVKYPFVLVDGKKYGNTSAITAWFDDNNYSFKWNGVEGRELVLYELKLKKQ